MHIYHGVMDARVSPPQIIGHEMSGVVAEIGQGVTNVALGDNVVVRPLDYCLECPACKAGHSHVCQNLKFMGIDTLEPSRALGQLKQEHYISYQVMFR